MFPMCYVLAMVSYNVVVGDTVTKVLVRMFGLSSTALLARRDFVVLLCTLSVTVPLCLQVSFIWITGKLLICACLEISRLPVPL